MSPEAVRHFLSFDVEEYFQVEAAAACVGRDRWGDHPCRCAASVERILELLAAEEVTATFFILGWVAEKERALIRRIAEAGHEIASHGMGHEMVGRMGREALTDDLRRSRELLEDIAGAAVTGYRAPTFSITRETAWALVALAEAGFRYDSSVFPVHHDRYGVPDAPRFAHKAVGPGGSVLVEIPPLTLRCLGANLPAGGGGYLRLLPVRVVGWALNAAQRQQKPGMIYLHPWELDPGQPVLPLGRLSGWRHRVGLAHTERKLRWLLSRYRFGAVRDQLDALEKTAAPEFRYASSPGG